MPFIPNPWILLGGLILAVGLFLSGLSIGVRWQKGREATNVVAIQKQTIDDANRDVEAETKRAVAAAKQEVEKRASFQIIKLKGERDALAKASPNCSRDSTSMGLLLDTIRSANGEKAAANELPKPVPATTAAD